MDELRRPRIAPLALLVVAVVGLWSYWVSGEVALTQQARAPRAAEVRLIEQDRECPFRARTTQRVDAHRNTARV